MKRIAGVLVAAAALGGAAIGAPSARAHRSSAARGEAARAAEDARQRAADALALALKSTESRASAAAGLPQLVNAMGPLGRERTAREGGAIDSQLVGTLQDLFHNEIPWQPFRRDFPVTALSVTGDELQVVDGTDGRPFAAGALVRKTRERGLASDLVPAGNAAFVAAAAQVVVPTLSEPVILVLARPLGEDVLAEVARRSGGAVMLSDGRTALASHGPPPEVASLAGLVGHEREGGGAADGSWAAAATALAPGLWLLARAATPAVAREASSWIRATTAGLWTMAALVAAAALAIGFRREKRPPVAGPGAPVAGPGAPLAATIAAPAPGPSQGQAFGRYVLVDRLGEGGMAQVYTAVAFGAEGFRRRFVIKRLRPELTSDPLVVAQFIDEAKLASSLVHSNVLPVFDFGKVDDEYFLATEYILGRDLTRLVRRHHEREGRPLPTPVALQCVHEVLRALEYAHGRLSDSGHPLGLVHRDVSPNNVLVSARGEVKLFDFGIVKAEGRVTQTEQGVVKGNVSFMAPEQARGAEVDARADLFSVGLVLFYCLTSDVLYRGDTTYELLVRAATGPGPEEQARIRALPAPAAALLVRALATDPAARYPSAAAFAADVAALPRASAGETAALVERLFGDELRREEQRFAAALPMQDPAGHARRS